MLSHKDQNKAQRYLGLLDESRCSGNWEGVASLKQKIAKHLPHRKCLQITIDTDYTLSTQSLDSTLISPSPSRIDYSGRVPEILTQLRYGNPTQEDHFQAEVCLSWLHWTIKQSDLALSRLPHDLAAIPDRLAPKGEELARWTYVCIVKGAYIRGSCQENAGNLKEAVQTYESMLPYISNAQSSYGSTIEHRRWTERLLARYCLLTCRYVKSKAHQPKDLLLSSSLIAPTFLLAPFRAWAEFWDIKLDQNTRNSSAPFYHRDISPIVVWQAYYDTLSTLSQFESTPSFISAMKTTFGEGDLPHEACFFATSKSQQCAELKRVESIYEGFLLNDLNFPKANEATPEVEAWVDQVMNNWSVLCGPTWRQEDHGDGGKEGTARNVLAILYRAATRSFHSTQILRYLFIVHSFLADFNLAAKALDTYFEIVIKGKARVEKSGEQELGLDDDATAIWTAAAGIKMLCFCGRRKEAERAADLGNVLRDWLRPHCSQEPVHSPERPTTVSIVHGRAVATGLCALGISQAHWANLTYDNSARSDLLTEAISNTGAASRSRFGEDKNVEILYYHSLALSRARNFDSAIRVIKNALSNQPNKIALRDYGFEKESDLDSVPDMYKRRFLLRSWHLLALLLSAEQNFSTSMSSCDAALELFGIQFVSGRLQIRGVDQGNLEIYDKESLVEIKMTQLALTEVVEGPDEAVNASGELLGLYAKLFRYTEHAVPMQSAPRPSSPPASRNGTVKSLRGSFLSRSRIMGSKMHGTGSDRSHTEPGSLASRESPEALREPPAIRVNSEDTLDSPKHSHYLIRHESKKLRKRNSRKSVGDDRRSRASSVSRKPNGNGHSQPSYPITSKQNQNTEAPPHDSDVALKLVDYEIPSDEVGLAISHDLPSSSTSSYVTRAIPLRLDPQIQPRLDQSTATKPPASSISFSPVPPLPPLFPLPLQKRHALTLLTKVWLFITSLYRRANMSSDAQGALSQAITHVTAIEYAVANSQSSAENFSAPAWGGLKSIGELWADVLAEKGRLHLAFGEREAAEEAYERALDWFQDHPGAIIGLADILLDFYSQSSQPASTVYSSTSIYAQSSKPMPTLAPLPTVSSSKPSPSTKKPEEDENLLQRLSARDRAYGLLSTLTKSGQGWDNAEAWFALARAYEESGQLNKAKEALLWVVDLEEKWPVRGWDSLGLF